MGGINDVPSDETSIIIWNLETIAAGGQLSDFVWNMMARLSVYAV